MIPFGSSHLPNDPVPESWKVAWHKESYDGTSLPAPGLRELDEYLMLQYELPKDLILQLSKTGSNTIGGPKLSLDLGVGLSDRIFMSDERKQEARARYGSYNEDLRINALGEVEAEILVRYFCLLYTSDAADEP